MKWLFLKMNGEVNMNNIKAILIDSGKVLNAPITGHWFITPNFLKYVDKNVFQSISKEEIIYAFGKAGEYISEQSLITDEEEEYTHFLEFYRIFANELPLLELKFEQIKAITEDLVYNYNKYEFYKDVIEVIPELSQKYKLAVVSDAWPSLENVYKKAAFRDYFSSFIISSMIGVSKPDEIMYTTALKELKISPDEAIFIDDNIRNCDGAKKLGIHTFLLCRDSNLYVNSKLTCQNHIVVQDFYEIRKIIM